MKIHAAQTLSENLAGKAFVNVHYAYDLELTDPDSGDTYTFYGARSRFTFHKDGTVTWVRQYDRSKNADAWTEPVKTVESYTVEYMGGFFYEEDALYLVLESGDVLEVVYSEAAEDEAQTLAGVNYSMRYDDDLHAPAALKDIDTSYVTADASAADSEDEIHHGTSLEPKKEFSKDYCGQCV